MRSDNCAAQISKLVLGSRGTEGRRNEIKDIHSGSGVGNDSNKEEEVYRG